jgi:hypothetical protein
MSNTFNSKNNPDFKSFIVIITGFLVLELIFKTSVFRYIALGFSICGIIFPSVIYGILWIWHKLGIALGWINTRILLGAVFYLFLFPISLLVRLSKNNMLNIKKIKHSIFIERNHMYKKSDLENTW